MGVAFCLLSNNLKNGRQQKDPMSCVGAKRSLGLKYMYTVSYSIYIYTYINVCAHCAHLQCFPGYWKRKGTPKKQNNKRRANSGEVNRPDMCHKLVAVMVLVPGELLTTVVCLGPPVERLEQRFPFVL